MALLQVAKLGNPILRQKAALVDLEALKSPENKIQALIDDMIETMHEEDGVGLAAPQVFQSLRLVVIECSPNERYSEAPNLPLIIMINPSITYYAQDTVSGWEGCLSLKDLRGLVPRPSNIVVKYFDRKGVPVTVKAEGFLAVVIQHEIDHLDGKVFLDRMTDLSQLSYLNEFEKYIADNKPIESESA